MLLTHLVSRPLLILTPALSRSQFAMPEDLRGLIDPPKLISDRPKLLAGPIFTSVPPLRADSRFGGRKGNGPLGGSAAHLGWGDLIEEHEARCRPIHAVPEPLCSARVSTIHMPTCGSNAYQHIGASPRCGQSASSRHSDNLCESPRLAPVDARVGSKTHLHVTLPIPRHHSAVSLVIS